MVQRNGGRGKQKVHSGRTNAKKTKAHLRAMALQTKPEANKWLRLNPLIARLAIDSFAFERGPPMIAKTHAHLVEEMNLAESEGDKSAEFVDRMYQITLEAFSTENVTKEVGFERTNSMLKALRTCPFW